MTRTCPKCASPLSPPCTGWRHLREHASASKWKKLFTTTRQYSCPQCHVALRMQFTWVGYLWQLGGLVAAFGTALVLWTLWPVNAPGNGPAAFFGGLLPVFSVMPFILCSLRWGTRWKLK